MTTLLNKLTIKTKLILLVAINITIFIIASGYAIQQMNSIGNEIEGIAERDLPLIEVVSAITVHQIEMEVLFERAARYGVLLGHEENAQAHFEETIAAFQKLGSKVEEEINQGEMLAEQAQQNALTDESKQEFGRIFDNLKAIHEEVLQFEAMSEAAFKLLAEGDGKAAELAVENIEKLADKVAHELSAMMVEIEHFTEAAAVTAELHEKSALKVLLVLIVVGLLLSAGLASLMISNIKGGLNTGIEAMDRIAMGDLSKPVHTDSKDEVGTMLNGLEAMRKQLSEVIGGIDSSSGTLSSASEELAAASEETSMSVNQQKQDTEQLAAAINQMAATVQEVATSTNTASESARRAMSESEQGRVAVGDTIESINTLADDVQRSADAITKLGEESDNIGMVLDVIRGIAEQTNLLALNAAIEAARAGEQGRGFAVVADEVRTLATRTHDSTQEIQSMIERLQVGAKESVHMMDESRKQMDESVSKATEAGEVLDVVLESVAQITDMNTHIASAAEEQSAVTEQLNHNIVAIAEVADQNACTSHQTSQASTELAETAVSLKNMIERFKLA